MSSPRRIGPFQTTPLDVVIDIEDIVTLHYFKYTPNFTFSGEKHDFWEIAYVDRGEVGVVAEGLGFDLRQGEAIFHKPGEYHNIWANNQYANVVILSFVCNSPAMDRFHNRIIPFSDEHRSILARILKTGEKAFKDPLNNVHQTGLCLAENPAIGSLQIIKNYMELLLISLLQGDSAELRESRTSPSAKLQGDNNVVEAVQQFLAQNIYHNLTLTDVLQQICFSKSYITRLFREHTGQSIMEYYLNLKIDEARRLISKRSLSFTEIAEQLNFNSIHHFSSSFKKHTNMTPTEYLRSVQSTEIL